MPLEEQTLILEPYFSGRISELYVERKYIACVCDVWEGSFWLCNWQDFGSHLPVETEYFLLGATLHPDEGHVKCFGAFLAHVAGEDAVEGCVVGLDWSGRLRTDHFN